MSNFRVRDISAALKSQAKALAAEKEISLNRLFIEAVYDYVCLGNRRSIRKRVNIEQAAKRTAQEKP
jgi:hypothetical protein